MIALNRGESVKKIEILEKCNKLLDEYFSDDNNNNQLYDAIFGGLSESDDMKTATWKMVIDSTRHASKIAVMTTLCLLMDLGVIECDASDEPIPPPVWGMPS